MSHSNMPVSTPEDGRNEPSSLFIQITKIQEAIIAECLESSGTHPSLSCVYDEATHLLMHAAVLYDNDNNLGPNDIQSLRRKIFTALAGHPDIGSDKAHELMELALHWHDYNGQPALEMARKRRVRRLALPYLQGELEICPETCVAVGAEFLNLQEKHNRLAARQAEAPDAERDDYGLI